MLKLSIELLPQRSRDTATVFRPYRRSSALSCFHSAFCHRLDDDRARSREGALGGHLNPFRPPPRRSRSTKGLPERRAPSPAGRYRWRVRRGSRVRRSRLSADDAAAALLRTCGVSPAPKAAREDGLFPERLHMTAEGLFLTPVAPTHRTVSLLSATFNGWHPRGLILNAG